MPRKSDLRKHFSGNLCIYCGEIANTVEHFPPRSLTNYGLLFTCCIECNILAGIEWSFDFKKRCNYVKEKLKIKYEKQLMMPEWTDKELKQLGVNLKKAIEKWLTQKIWIEKRIAWNVESYIAVIDPNNYFARFHARIDIIMEYEKNNLKLLKKLLKPLNEFLV